MQVINQWIVSDGKLMVQVENGDYYIGTQTNVYGFSKLPKDEAEKLKVRTSVE